MISRSILSVACAALVAAAVAAGSGQAARGPGVRVERMDLVATMDSLPAANPHAGEKLVYRVNIANAGAATARDVRVGVKLFSAADLTFDLLEVRAVRPDGSLLGRCVSTSLLERQSVAVTCWLGEVPAGASRQVRVVTRPLTSGRLVASAQVHGVGLEHNLFNNYAGVWTLVL